MYTKCWSETLKKGLLTRHMLRYQYNIKMHLSYTAKLDIAFN